MRREVVHICLRVWGWGVEKTLLPTLLLVATDTSRRALAFCFVGHLRQDFLFVKPKERLIFCMVLLYCRCRRLRKGLDRPGVSRKRKEGMG